MLRRTFLFGGLIVLACIFTTSAWAGIAPTTTAATSITATTAVVNGTSNQGLGTYTYHFDYGPLTGVSCTAGMLVNATSGVSQTAGASHAVTLTGLTGSTTYCFRIVEAGGGLNGNILSFTTLGGSATPSATAVNPTTKAASDVTTASATLHGVVGTYGDVYHFEWGTTTGYGNVTTATFGGLGDLSATITGLTPGTTYHFRIATFAGGGDLTFTTAQLVDLAVSGSVDKSTVGASVTYAFTVTNGGPGDAAGTAVALTLPSGATFEHALTAAGTCTSSAPVTCSLGQLAKGASATITVALTPTAKCDLAVTATATSSATDSNTANNTATATSTAAAPSDLSLSAAGPATAKVRDKLTFTFVVTNTGSTTVTGAKLSMKWVGGHIPLVSPPSCKDTGSLTCPIPKLAPKQKVTLTVIVSPKDAANYVLTATTVQDFDDPTPDDNTDVVRTVAKKK